MTDETAPTRDSDTDTDSDSDTDGDSDSDSSDNDSSDSDTDSDTDTDTEPKPKTELHQDRFRVGFSRIPKSDWDRIFGDSKDSTEKLANAQVKTGRKTRRG